MSDKQLLHIVVGGELSDLNSTNFKDLSKLGTTVDGRPVPRSLETGNAEVKDLDQWIDVPDKAKIGLAGVVAAAKSGTG